MVDDRFENVRFVVITGVSGAGKSIVVQSFEDLGYFCVDNLPPTFIPKFAEMLRQSEGKITKIALVSDIRGGKFFDSLQSSLNQLQEMGIEYEVLFLEADNTDLIKRYKETRRKHPLSAQYNSIKEAIDKEEEKLQIIRNKADRIVNTSDMTPKQLKEKVTRLYTSEGEYQRNLSISIISFGFKHGIPLDADLVFDVRFLPNPYYIDELRPMTGNDKQITDYVLDMKVTKEFLSKLQNLLHFMLPLYLKEGRSQLIIAVGCTGGKHRSVVISNWLEDRLSKSGYLTSCAHRDMDKS